MTKNNITITVSLFGVVQQLAHQNKLILEIESGSSLTMVREKLRETLTQLTPQPDKLEILNHCVLANANQILTEDEIIYQSIELAILPPFSGG